MWMGGTILLTPHDWQAVCFGRFHGKSLVWIKLFWATPCAGGLTQGSAGICLCVALQGMTNVAQRGPSPACSQRCSLSLSGLSVKSKSPVVKSVNLVLYQMLGYWRAVILRGKILSCPGNLLFNLAYLNNTPASHSGIHGFGFFPLPGLSLAFGIKRHCG